jgi:hypothetical protein
MCSWPCLSSYFCFPAYILFIARYKRSRISSRKRLRIPVSSGCSSVRWCCFCRRCSSSDRPRCRSSTWCQKERWPRVTTSFSYNRIEIFIAILLGLLTAVTQYLKYKGTTGDYLVKKIMAAHGHCAGALGADQCFGGIHYDKYGASVFWRRSTWRCLPPSMPSWPMPPISVSG